MTIVEKIAYIKGLAEGMGLSDENKEGKILTEVIELLDDMAHKIEDLDNENGEILDELDAISEDLGDVEDIIYGDECCDDECCGEDEDYCEPEEDFNDETEADDEYEFEVTCPECNTDIAITEAQLMEGKIVCPSCGEELEFEYDEEEE